MTRKRSHGISRATFAATIVIVSGGIAFGQQGHSGMAANPKPAQTAVPQHQHDMSSMSGMKHDPHQALAMAYEANLEIFAKALRQEATQAKTVNPEFARAAVAEMKRDFERMEQHHQDHMKTMDDSMKAQMAGMMKPMDAHHTAIQEHLAALDKEVQGSAPDSGSVSKHVAEILKHCDDMTRMHAGMMEHKMAAPKAQPKN